MIPLTPENFEQHKQRIMKIIENLKIEDLDPNFQMSYKQGVITGNHAYECDSCNILHYLMSFTINKHRLITPSEKQELNVKTSGDFEHDPKGALHALDKTNIAVFLISKSWFDDKRAQAEWQHTIDLGKPMIYIFRNISSNDIKVKSIKSHPNLCGTINDNGDDTATMIKLRKMIESVAKTQKMQ